jgi:hypothetical protein
MKARRALFKMHNEFAMIPGFQGHNQRPRSVSHTPEVSNSASPFTRLNANLVWTEWQLKADTTVTETRLHRASAFLGR